MVVNPRMSAKNTVTGIVSPPSSIFFPCVTSSTTCRLAYFPNASLSWSRSFNPCSAWLNAPAPRAPPAVPPHRPPASAPPLALGPRIAFAAPHRPPVHPHRPVPPHPPLQVIEVLAVHRADQDQGPDLDGAVQPLHRLRHHH